MFENDLSPQEVVSLIESQAEVVSGKISSLTERNEKPDKDLDGTTEADGEGKKKKKKYGPEGSDSPDTPEDVQKELSGESKTTQYGEATEEDLEEEDLEEEDLEEEDEETSPSSKNKMSKEDFFASLDSITNLLSGDEDNTEAANDK